MKIKTTYVCPPVPERSFDWSAIDEDTYNGSGSPIGFGATEQDAVKDLMDQMEKEECPHDEHDHGICLSCGRDIFDDIVGQAELWRDC